MTENDAEQVEALSRFIVDKAVFKEISCTEALELVNLLRWLREHHKTVKNHIMELKSIRTIEEEQKKKKPRRKRPKK